MGQIRHWLLALSIVGVGLVALFAVACGDDEENATTATPTDAASETAEEATTIGISLTEWAITASEGGALASVPAGEVQFEVHNDGQAPHELVIIKTDTDPAAFPASGGKVDEEAVGELIGEVEDFPGGETETGTFGLQPGAYALICNVAGHYEQGMYAQLIVE